MAGRSGGLPRVGVRPPSTRSCSSSSPLEHVRVARKLVDQERQRRRGRVVAAEQQVHHLVAQLSGGEPIPILVPRLEQQAEQVACRAPARRAAGGPICPRMILSSARRFACIRAHGEPGPRSTIITSPCPRTRARARTRPRHVVRALPNAGRARAARASRYSSPRRGPTRRSRPSRPARHSRSARPVSSTITSTAASSRRRWNAGIMIRRDRSWYSQSIVISPSPISGISVAEHPLAPAEVLRVETACSGSPPGRSSTRCCRGRSAA